MAQDRATRQGENASLRYSQGALPMQMPSAKPGFTQTYPKGSVQSESCVQNFRQASPPSSTHTSSGPEQPNPGHWQTRAPQPANVQYCRQMPAPEHSASVAHGGPTQ